MNRISETDDFLHEGLGAFLAAQGFREQPGDMVDASGRILGRYSGVWRYTVGQRRGLNLPDATPWYVQAIDAAHNRLILGKEEELRQADCTVRGRQIGRASCGKECRSRWSPYH